MTLTKLSTRQILAFPECDYLNAEFLRNAYRAYKKGKIDATTLYQLAHCGSLVGVFASKQWSFPRIPKRVSKIIEET